MYTAFVALNINLVHAKDCRSADGRYLSMSEKTEITLTVSAELTRGTNGLSLDMGKFANLVCIRTALTKRGLCGSVVRLLVARAKGLWFDSPITQHVQRLIS